MNKLVFSVFKTIAFSMIFVFVFDIVFYVYRVSSLNQRMENIMTSLQKVVMENNYLPSENASMYSQMFKDLAEDFNGEPFYNDGNGEFIAHIGWNLNTPAVDSRGNPLNASNSPLQVTGTRTTFQNDSWVERNVNLVHYKMGEVGGYGDIQTIQVRVEVYQPLWSFGSSGRGYYRGNDSGIQGGEYGSQNFVRDARGSSTVLSYTYYVPCLKYQSVTQ